MRKKRGSILDLFLIFLFLLCIVGGLLRLRELRVQNTPVATQPYTLTVVVSRIDPQTADCVEVGEQVYTESGTLFGSVSAKEILPARVTLTDGGAYVVGQWDAEIFVELTLEIEVEAMQNGHAILHQATTPLSVGESLTLCGERTALRVSLYKISPNTP